MVKLTRQEAFAELGVTEAAGDAEVRAAYKKLAREWHPDKNTAVNATEKFQRVNAAYHRITQGGLDDDDDYDDFAEEDIFDFFEAFFFRGRAPPPRRGPPPWAAAGGGGGGGGGGGCPCGRPGCMGGGPPPFFPGMGGMGGIFMFGPGGRGGGRGAGPAAGAHGGGRGAAGNGYHDYYKEDYDDDDDDYFDDDDDFDEEDRDFYDWLPTPEPETQYPAPQPLRSLPLSLWPPSWASGALAACAALLIQGFGFAV